MLIPGKSHSQVEREIPGLAAETSVPYQLDTPLSFVLRRPSIWYAGHSCGEANKRSIDSKREVTGSNYPAHNRPIFVGH